MAETARYEKRVFCSVGPPPNVAGIVATIARDGDVYAATVVCRSDQERDSVGREVLTDERGTRFIWFEKRGDVGVVGMFLPAEPRRRVPVNARVVADEIVAAYPEGDTSPSARRFAARQLEVGQRYGFPMTCLRAVMEVSGPTHLPGALLYALRVRKSGVNLDLVDCLLCGLRRDPDDGRYVAGTSGFGRERMEAALKDAGIPLPTAETSRAFFSVLAGAREALRYWPKDGRVFPQLPERFLERVGEVAS